MKLQLCWFRLTIEIQLFFVIINKIIFSAITITILHTHKKTARIIRNSKWIHQFEHSSSGIFIFKLNKIDLDVIFFSFRKNFFFLFFGSVCLKFFFFQLSEIFVHNSFSFDSKCWICYVKRLFTSHKYTFSFRFLFLFFIFFFLLQFYLPCILWLFT